MHWDWNHEPQEHVTEVTVRFVFKILQNNKCLCVVHSIVDAK
jgi:hypothetical protein